MRGVEGGGWRVGLLALFAAGLLALVACKGEVRGLDEQCVECAAGGGGGAYVGVGDACTQWRYYDCEEGLYCNLGDQACREYAEEGANCNEHTLCDDGLVCGQSGTCEVPVPLGEPCAFVDTCEAGSCNGGGVADDPRTGTCELEEGDVGAVCAWRASPSGPGALDGCRQGLVCQPLSVPDPASVVSSAEPDACCSTCEGPAEGCLGYAGVCAEPGTGQRGDPCTDDAACASGRCMWTRPPRLRGALAEHVQVSPWPGLCAGPEDEGTDSSCYPPTGRCDLRCESASDCLPSMLCREGWCYSYNQGELEDECGARHYEFSDHPEPDDFCALGYACANDPQECRLEGTGTDGDPCTTDSECASGHSCAHEICRPHGTDGASCDVERLCAVGLRCNPDTLLCDEPGPGADNDECATVADCGWNLTCYDCPSPDTCTTGICGGLAEEGAGCSPTAGQYWRCGPGLECLLDPDDPSEYICQWP